MPANCPPAANLSKLLFKQPYQGQAILVIGGGFYGCNIAEYLAYQGASVTLIEQATDIMTRASYNNQARLHNGYHYPRSFSTAFRSHYNFARFFQDYRPAIATDFIKLYAIARIGSKVSPRQFELFCQSIEAPLRPASPRLSKLFSSRLVAAVYETIEYAFDAAILRRLLVERLDRAGVRVKLNTVIIAVQYDAKKNLIAAVDSQGNTIMVDYVFNCTYSGRNSIPGISPSKLPLKHEITELALIELPPELADISVTVMDGSFFSLMPFPDRQLSTLSHVRYTPHTAWKEIPGDTPNPYETLDTTPKTSAFNYMIRDAQRYIPTLTNAIYRDSLFEVKTVLVKNEKDDGRPILFESDVQHPQIISILGSKIDNIYDALIAIDSTIINY